MFELYLHDAAKTERGARAAVIGAVAGIIPAIGLGCVRVLNSELPEAAAELAGTIAFTLAYAAPYLLAFWRWQRCTGKSRRSRSRFTPQVSARGQPRPPEESAWRAKPESSPPRQSSARNPTQHT